MNVHRVYLVFAIAFLLRFMQAHGSTEPLASIPAANSPINIIFDTDMWSDIDDALALAMLHALEDRGEVKLAAVTISTNDPWCASYVSLVNTFYGHSEVPIGINRGGMNLEFLRKKLPQLDWPVTRYTRSISEQRNRDGAWTYPHADGTKAGEAVTLLRKTLAAQPDRSVVMIQVGYSTNLARLLDSPSDEISILDGRELIAAKVRLLSVMAGNFGETTFQGGKFPRGSPEFNVLADVPSAQALFANWPTPIVASGFEIGLDLLYPPESIEHDYAYVPHHPIAQTYRTFCEEQKERLRLASCPHAHATFDLTAVLYAARPGRNYFSLSSPGQITISDDGSSHFEEIPEGRHRFLILREEQKARTLEAMVMLVSQPPRHTSQR